MKHSTGALHVITQEQLRYQIKFKNNFSGVRSNQVNKIIDEFEK